MTTAPPLASLLVCPRCHGPLHDRGQILACAGDSCGFEAVTADGVVSLMPAEAGPAFFDAHAAELAGWIEQPGIYELCYAQQTEALARILRGRRVVVDIGCGSRLVYRRPAEWLLIGVELSRESLRCNAELDVRLHASATALPLPPRSVDAVVCFYSIHHIVGGTVRETARLVTAAFVEFGRVLKAGGDLLVFEVSPWPIAWTAERLAWTPARRLLGPRLDMFFWARRALARLAARQFPPGTRLEYRAFAVPPLTTFPPVFGVPWLRIPRVLYPFHVCLYHWRIG
jgi:SAM-dependent methyltransferase